MKNTTKTLILLLAIACLFLSFSVNNTKLKKVIKSLTRIEYKIERDSAIMTSRDYTENNEHGSKIYTETYSGQYLKSKNFLAYDDRGNLISDRHYQYSRDNDSTLTEYTFYKYDSTGRKAECIRSTDRYKYISKYDSAGHIVEEYDTAYSTSTDPHTMRGVYKYNPRGQIIAAYSYKNGELDLIDTNKYNEKGQWMGRFEARDSAKVKDAFIHPSNWIAYNSQGHLIRSGNTSYKYNKKGRKIEMTTINYQGYKDIFKYNKQGYMIEYDSYGLDSVTGRRHMLQEKKYGKIIDSLFDDKGQLIGSVFARKQTFTYDKYGNRTKEEDYRARDKRLDITIQKYTYDKIGNWTIDSTFVNDTLIYIRTQQIEYY